MARIARVVVPGYPLHVTQRGNQRRWVFHSDHDHHLYLKTLKQRCEEYAVSLHAYCLMPNHVHLVVVPSNEKGLARALGVAHSEYARWHNLTYETPGHLWQNRFFSCLLDEEHYWHALRYVELNPVLAGLSEDAPNWPWSSARERLAPPGSPTLVDLKRWRERYTANEWIEALNLGIPDADMLRRIRESTRTGRPIGDQDFVKRLERETGRRLTPNKRGRKPKARAAAALSGQLQLVN